MNHGRIYQDFLTRCEPYAGEEPWRRFASGGGLWLSPECAAAALGWLRGRYSDEDLIASGVATAGLGGRMPPNARLVARPGIVLPLRRRPGARPFDLLVEAGTVSGRLPVCAALRDGFTKDAIAEVGGLLVVFSAKSLAALRFLGFPVTMASGLARLSGAGLADFFKSFGPPSEGSPAASRTRLVFVDWSLSGLVRSRPGELETIRSHFRDLHAHLGLPVEDLLVWTPSVAGAEDVRYCVRYGSRDHVRAAIQRGMSGGLTELTAADGDRPLPQDLPGLMATLRQTLRDRTGGRRLERRLWKECEERRDAEIIAPLIKEALHALDPVERSRLLSIAGIDRLLFPATEAVAANLVRRITKLGTGKAMRASASEIGPLLKLYTVLLHLLKAGN